MLCGLIAALARAPVAAWLSRTEPIVHVQLLDRARRMVAGVEAGVEEVEGVGGADTLKSTTINPVGSISDSSHTTFNTFSRQLAVCPFPVRLDPVKSAILTSRLLTPVHFGDKIAALQSVI